MWGRGRRTTEAISKVLWAVCLETDTSTRGVGSAGQFVADDQRQVPTRRCIAPCTTHVSLTLQLASGMERGPPLHSVQAVSCDAGRGAHKSVTLGGWRNHRFGRASPVAPALLAHDALQSKQATTAIDSPHRLLSGCGVATLSHMKALVMTMAATCMGLVPPSGRRVPQGKCANPPGM